MRHYLFILSCVLFITACDPSDNPPTGTVAMVNGQAISLRQVDELYTHDESARTMAHDPSVERLQSQYGDVLTSLIVNALMEQELKKLKHDITDADVEKIEKQVRSNYPGDAFEKKLDEEYIHLETWRMMLRQQLITKRFQEVVLRPLVRISKEEVRSAYAKKQERMQTPSRVSMTIYHDVDKARVEQARAALLAQKGTPLADEIVTQDAAKAQKNAESTPTNNAEDETANAPTSMPGAPKTDAAKAQDVAKATAAIFQDTLHIALNRLPPSWREAIEQTKPNTPTPIVFWESEYHFFVADSPIAEHTLSFTEAYAYIEQELLEEKIEPAFTAWLEQAVKSAQITVSTHLLPTQSKDKE